MGLGSGMRQRSRVFLCTGGVVGVAVVVIILLVVNTKQQKNAINETVSERAHRILQQTPIIDGHNDVPYNLRLFVNNDLSRVDLNSDLTKVEPWASENRSHTDIPRLKKGQVGAQFWAAYTPCDSQNKDAVGQTIQQIDLIRRMVANYSEDLQWALSVADIKDAMKKKKIASLIGVEGGHSIQSNFGILRTLYNLGARYMTLTHSCNTPWADSSPVDVNLLQSQTHNEGLSPFGLKIVDEMNRLGLIIDISHVSTKTMRAALKNSKAPVIFSHSSARTICDVHRNVPDDILDLVKEKESLVMVNFNSKFVQCDPTKNATINDVVEHITYIKNRTSADNVGIGADYDGVQTVPIGLEDVSKFPDLFVKLIETELWTDEELEKLAGRNLLRVFSKVEKVRDSMAAQPPHQESLVKSELKDFGTDYGCIAAKFL